MSGPFDLAAFQALLYRLITAPNGVEEGLRAEKHPPAGGLESIIAGDARMPAHERLGIYANAYFYRLLDALKEDYPATLAVLGEVNFHNLATGYLIEYPPSDPNVYYAGRYLAGYLRDHPMARARPFIAGLASLERIVSEVFHAAGAKPLDAAAMRAVPPADWPALALRMIPAARLLDLHWEVDAVLRAVESGEAWSEPPAGARCVLVWRRNSRVDYRAVDRAERAALELARGGAAFAAICGAIAAESESADPAGAINAMLSRWLGDGLVMLAQPPADAAS
jgi:hypothetical protein